MQDHPTPAVHGIVDLFTRTERGDDDGDLVLLADRHVGFKPVVRLVDDLIDGVWGGRTIRMLRVVLGQFGCNPVEPLVERTFRPRIQRGKRTDNACLALRNDEVGIRDDEKRRGDNGNRKPTRED
ncbi:hypothetical protein D3C72_1887840 [compost metagenome]